ncbi:hypothetical protein EMIHUDRAFT_235264 [Emiliania huxleyi CCMP1516]|uniref:Uncharacterized protein n=2 Tax=Emiliania huxleyi TaxID=2903 RepID=A0A0D3JX24_EMIH1|nr:hypothetical protein EMIHUDRAFT_235264 [Emiliania huxleyi CCMP1516]EOD28059.1 hypothetical protein EMIHUDRAFT_235264 [Emiliania huxleyi CCMP1516]|eukprot:XP_005780488.1 hypothetical protein EMIHUDRAFT_235264 [Emiliania huxleyi CCMP1516]
MQPRALATGALAAALLCLCIPTSLAAPQAGPAIDASHAMMEPPPAKQPRPYVRPPAGSRLAAGSGVYRKLLSVSTPRSAATLAAAAVTITCLVSRSAASRLVLHIMCFIGSLLEPFDSVLPKRSALRPFIEQARRVRVHV